MRFAELETSVMTYINREFCSKLTDWRKWALPLAVRMYLPTLKQKLFDNLDMFKQSGMILEDGSICIDEIYKQLSCVARDTGDIKCNIPTIGEVTFKSGDIDSLYQIIKQEEQSRMNMGGYNSTVNNTI